MNEGLLLLSGIILFICGALWMVRESRQRSLREMPFHARMWLVSALSSTAFALFGAGFASAVGAPWPFVPSAWAVLLACGEEFFFRGLARKKVGTLAALVLYALLMPFAFASEFGAYLSLVVLFAALGTLSSWLADSFGMIGALAFRLLLLAIVFAASFVPNLPIGILVLLVALWAVHRSGKNAREWFVACGVHTKDAPLGKEMVFGVGLAVIAALLIWVEALVLGAFGAQDSARVGQVIARQGLVSLALLVTLSPIGEEMLFRGVLQKKVGVVFASMVFAILHASFGSVMELVAAFSIAMLFGAFVRSRTHGGIIPVIVAHAMLNMLAIYSVFA